LTDTGTSAAGRPVTIQEFAIYRMAGGRIVAVWEISARIVWRQSEESLSNWRTPSVKAAI
jgi:hypothetical protein